MSGKITRKKLKGVWASFDNEKEAKRVGKLIAQKISGILVGYSENGKVLIASENQKDLEDAEKLISEYNEEGIKTLV